MTVKKIIEEAMDKNALGFETALKEELRERIRLALEAKMEEDMKEEVELDESWSDGISSRTQHVFARKAAMDMQKANAARKYAKGYPTDHPQHNKNMADYHSAMAKYVKNSYHAGQYGSQSDAKPDHKEHMTAAKEYRAKSNMSEEVEQIDEISKKTLVNYMDKSKKQTTDIQKKFKKGTETKDDEKTFDRRVSGQIKAIDKFHGRAKVPASGVDKAYDYAQKALRKEEVEQIDEISGAKLGDYIVKSRADVKARKERGEKTRQEIIKQYPELKGISGPVDSKTWMRPKSQNLAVKKLTGNARINATENKEE
jgi:hypothetical protein